MAEDQTPEKLQVARVDNVVVLKMDDGRANALSPDMSTAIAGSLAAAAADETVTAVVLAGNAKLFSAGFDLNIMASGDRAATAAMVSDGGALVRQLYGCDVPVVAACTGHAVAAGALMLLGCDLRIGPDAPVKIGLNEVAIGMTLPAWALTIAAARLSKRHLQRCVVNATLLDGSGAADAGFLDDVVAPEQVLDVAIQTASELDALDRTAYRNTIAAFRGNTLALMDQQLAADRAAT